MIFGTYYETESPIHALDPRTKFLCALIATIIGFFAWSPAALGVLCLFTAVCYVIAKVPFKTAVRAVAPLIFISLVENAFKHGVSPTEPSFIHITILADNQQICCDIENSNHPKTSEDNSGHGIGLSQVQRRLDLAYPERYTWTKGVSENGQTYRSVITIASSTAN